STSPLALKTRRYEVCSAVALVFGLGVVSANPIEKRAATSDKVTVGHATLSGGTTGGSSAAATTVTTLAVLKSALATGGKVVLISGTITGNEVVKVPANTSVIGKSGAILAEAGDALGIQAANRVWVDSVELWSDRDHDKDYYGGLLDIPYGCYAVSVTNSYLHDHWKASLVGHSDSNESEDKAIQENFLSNNDGINTRVGAELLVQNNVFESVSKPLYSTDNGYANASGNDFGGASNTALTTSWSSVGYSYTLTATASVKSYVNFNAGAKLSF
ncbi:hypothetical protein FS749_007606, partial [Ceratobasidium sp. UAMH 11750]